MMNFIQNFFATNNRQRGINIEMIKPKEKFDVFKNTGNYENTDLEETNVSKEKYINSPQKSTEKIIQRNESEIIFKNNLPKISEDSDEANVSDSKIKNVLQKIQDKETFKINLPNQYTPIQENNGFFNKVFRLLSSTWSVCANIFSKCFSRENAQEQFTLENDVNQYSQNQGFQQMKYIPHNQTLKNAQQILFDDEYAVGSEKAVEDYNQFENKKIKTKSISDRQTIKNDIVNIINIIKRNKIQIDQSKLNEALRIVNVRDNIDIYSFNESQINLSISQLLALKIFLLSYIPNERLKFELPYNSNQLEEQNILKHIQNPTDNDRRLILQKKGDLDYLDNVEITEVIYNNKIGKEKHRGILITRNDKGEITQILKFNANNTKGGSYNKNTVLDHIKGKKNAQGERENRQLLSVPFGEGYICYKNTINQKELNELKNKCKTNKIPVVVPQYVEIKIAHRNGSKAGSLQPYIKGKNLFECFQEINKGNLKYFMNVGIALQKGIEHYQQLETLGYIDPDNNDANVIFINNELYIIDIDDMNTKEVLSKQNLAVFHWFFALLNNTHLQTKDNGQLQTIQNNKIGLSHLLGILMWLPVTQEVQILFVYIASQFNNIQVNQDKSLQITRKDPSETCLVDNKKTQELLSTITNVLYYISQQFIDIPNQVEESKKTLNKTKNFSSTANNNPNINVEDLIKNRKAQYDFVQIFRYQNTAKLAYNNSHLDLLINNQFDQKELNRKINKMSTQGEFTRKKIESKQNREQ